MQTEIQTSSPEPTMAQCPSCFGRGYRPEARKTAVKSYTRGMGFYARTCGRCQGRGEIEAKRLRKSER